jgi:sphingomyelin phosphodiesterase 2
MERGAEVDESFFCSVLCRKMHASGEGQEVDQSHRMAQAWQLSDHIRASAERGRYVIAVSHHVVSSYSGIHRDPADRSSHVQAGDFNSSPWSLPVSIMKDYGCLLDSWSESHPVSTLKSDSPTSPEEAIEAFGMTCDSPLNSYSAGKPLTDSAKHWKGKRLDYIFYRGPDIARRRPLVWKHKHRARDGEGAILEEGEPISDSMDDAPSLVCVDSRVVLTGLVPNQTFSYSDHFGLCSTFEIVPARSDVDQAVEGDEPKNRPLPSQAEGGTNDTAEPLVTLDVEDLGAACSNGQRPHQPTRPRMSNRSSSKTATVNSACLTLRTYLALAQRQSKLQLRIFGGSIFLALALTISSAWQPKSWIQPIWTILGVAAGALGATMLYVGFVWGRWEQNLLMEVVEQMELELRVSAMEDKALN